MCAFKDVLVIRFRGEEKCRCFGVYSRFEVISQYSAGYVNYSPPSGNNGFILGDIFGLNAGLTCTELVLFRFLLPRPVGFDSIRLLATDPVGEASALNCGLGIIELEALVIGALVGPNLGVFLADNVGVV